MKKFISVLLTIILIFGCLPITSFAAPKSKKYEKNLWTEKEEGKHVTVELHVAASDMGKVIGKQGRIAKAIRAVVKAASSKDNKKVDVEIV